MHRLIICAAMLFSLLFYPDAALCIPEQPARKQIEHHNCVTSNENGSINWTTGIITTVGHASPKDNRKLSQESVPGAARADAKRRLIRMLKQIKITPALSVAEYADQSDIILAGIEKTARDAVAIRQDYTSDLAVDITLKTSILGGFLQLVLPEEIRQIPGITPQGGGSPEAPEENLYTGMIIDARGLNVEPVLNPEIIAENGNRVYSGEFISREFAVQNGICKYVCTPEAARNDHRIGNHPLFFQGIEKRG